MPLTLTKEEFIVRKRELLPLLSTGIFVYPTDTIYGLGCNALDERLVARLRELKGRESKPLSVIAPSKTWIRNHTHITAAAEDWLARLPGPYTLVLKRRDDGVSPALTLGGETLGVRIPGNWFSHVIAELGTPIVTTSVNLSGKPPVASVKDIPEAIRDGLDLIIDDGELPGRPSTIVLLDRDEPEVVVR